MAKGTDYRISNHDIADVHQVKIHSAIPQGRQFHETLRAAPGTNKGKSLDDYCIWGFNFRWLILESDDSDD
jgi:hypothetical protein